jgi:hypothetical protein
VGEASNYESNAVSRCWGALDGKTSFNLMLSLQKVRYYCRLENLLVQKLLSALNVCDISCVAHPASCFMTKEDRGVKRPAVKFILLLPSSDEVKNGWIHASTTHTP